MARCGLSAAVGVMLAIGGAQAASPPSITATYTVTTQAATCDLKLNTGSTVALGDVRQTAFQSSATPGTTQGKVITLQLINCAGTGGTKVPKVSVYGDRDGVTDATLYRKSTSVAAGVGFILTQDNTGKGTPLTAGTQTSPTKVRVPGTDGSTNPNNKTIDFYVQASRGTQAASGVTSGTLTTSLHFDFLYD